MLRVKLNEKYNWVKGLSKGKKIIKSIAKIGLTDEFILGI